MSDGGVFPWRVQRLVSRGPVADYSGLRDPLPSPPAGMRWSQNPETREWALVPSDNNGPDHFPSVAGGSGGDTAAESTTSTSSHQHPNEDDWELLSDKNPRGVGSVRSLSSMESFGHTSNGSHANLSVPFKIARTHSSSTIDSSDNNPTSNGGLGPSGKGVLGIDYVEHVVLPSDTLQGICLAYKINSQRLKQANHFSGGTLLLAPKRLVIPISHKALRSGFIRVQDTDAKEYKVHALLSEFPDLSVTEAKAYLELADWDLAEGVRSAREDGEWEKELGDADALHSGQIQFKFKGGRLQASGAGLARSPPRKSTVGPEGKEAAAPAVVTPKREPPRIVSREEIPDIATKSVKAHDIYAAAPQHDSYGVELKALRQPLLPEEGSS